MSKNLPTTITMPVFSAAVAALFAFSTPALARHGGHHHGECGEHGYRCGYFEHEGHHHGGHHEHHFEPYHRSRHQAPAAGASQGGAAQGSNRQGGTGNPAPAPPTGPTGAGNGQ